MFRVGALAVALCLYLASAVVVDAYSLPMVGTSVSAFGGAILLTPPPGDNVRHVHHHYNLLTMKKGKGSRVPPQMRGNYQRQKEMAQQRQQMEAMQRPGPDGMPVFNLFVRTPRGNMWYPCGSFKGDEKSQALAKSVASKGLLAGISKNQLDAGIAGSLYRDIPKLQESIFRNYPQLRKTVNAGGKLEYGYKLAFDELSEEQAKEITVVEPKEQKGIFDGIKGMFGQ